MRLVDLKSQLKAKQRSIKDLLRFIETRTDNNPNYTLLLGAGCSITSGVRSASALSHLWRTEVISDLSPAHLDKSVFEQQEWLKRHEGDWYDCQREYSTLFEKKYDLQRQRRMFVENEVKDAIPSIGYAYLTSLIDRDYFNAVFTTNFDDLVNEAFFLYSNNRPIVCAHDSSINSVTITSRRPKIIKLHGDYLFDDIKATDRETESLGQNMKEKFVEFAKDYGIIIVGYSGNDRSIMDTLSGLLKNEDYFKHGIYWCLRQDSDVSEDLRRLLWRERVYFVEIDGFDELFADMYVHLSNGELIPPATTLGKSRYESVIRKLMDRVDAFPTTSENLRAAREIFVRQSKRKAIANQIINPDDKDRPLAQIDFTDDDLLLLTHLERLNREKNYNELIQEARMQLQLQERPNMRDRIANLLINAYLSTQRDDDALQLIDKMDVDFPYGTRWLLKKARILNAPDDRLRILKIALERNPQSAETLRELGKWYSEQCANEIGEKRIENYGLAYEYFHQSIIADPSKNNSAWSLKHRLIKNNEKNIAKRHRELKEVEDTLSLQGDNGWTLLSLKADRIDSTSDKTEYRHMIDALNNAKKKNPKPLEVHFDRLLLSTHLSFQDFDAAKLVLDSLYSLGLHSTDSDLAYDISSAMRKGFAMDEIALEVLRDNIDTDDFNVHVMSQYFYGLIETSKFDEARELINRFEPNIKSTYKLKLESELLERQGKITEAIDCINRRESLGAPVDPSVHSYLLLLSGKINEAKKYCQDFLNGIGYSIEQGAVVINFELARKMSGSKPDNGRLDALLKYDPTDINRAAVAALKDHKKEAIDAIKQQLKKDKTFRFDVARWPVFKEIYIDPEYKALVQNYKFS